MRRGECEFRRCEIGRMNGSSGCDRWKRGLEMKVLNKTEKESKDGAAIWRWTGVDGGEGTMRALRLSEGE
jgi:hypothetical protein